MIGTPAPLPGEPPGARWYESLASHLKGAYLRYSFTKGSAAEVGFLWDQLTLGPGSKILDVGCGPGRHLVEFALRGADATGIDISHDFLRVAADLATGSGVEVHLVAGDARRIPCRPVFDSVVSLCEGGFGLGLDDKAIMLSMVSCLRPGGRLALAAPNAAFVKAHLGGSGRFDPTTMLYEETVTSVIGEGGATKTFTMWNSCHSPESLHGLAEQAGLEVIGIFGISPGEYDMTAPTNDHPELLMIALRRYPPKMP